MNFSLPQRFQVLALCLIGISQFTSAQAQSSAICGARGIDAGPTGRVTLCQCNGNYYKLLDDTNPCLRRNGRLEATKTKVSAVDSKIIPLFDSVTPPTFPASPDATFQDYLAKNRAVLSDIPDSAAHSIADQPEVFHNDPQVQHLLEAVNAAEAANHCPTLPADIAHLKEIYEKGHAIRLEERTNFAFMVGRDYRVCGYNESVSAWFDVRTHFDSATQYTSTEQNCTHSSIALPNQKFRFEFQPACGLTSVRAQGTMGDMVLTSIGNDAYVQTALSLESKPYGFFLFFPIQK